MEKERISQQSQTYPYGFKLWMNQLWQIGKDRGVWNFDVISYRERLCFKSWIVYFMDGLSPAKALEMDIMEGGE